MTIAIIVCLLPAIGYLLLIAVYARGWAMQPAFTVQPHYIPHTTISVIIPARNEEGNIGACLSSLLAQQYPLGLIEIIVVDDHSDDRTAEVVSLYAGKGVKCISLQQYLAGNTAVRSYKKAALSAGIASSRGELIVTTDADCTAPPAWLLHLAACYEQHHPQMIVAPVAYSGGATLSDVFQIIDFMSMQGITAAAHSLKLGNMCNGANLAFTRAAFHTVNGYTGVDHLASGDDYLLMTKVASVYPSGIAYLRSQQAIVTTPPQPSWGSFLQQRIRWASKSGKYDDGKLTALLLLVYIFNVSLLGMALAGLFYPVFLWLALAAFTAKAVAEYLFIYPVAAFFARRHLLLYFFLLQPLHVLYIVAAGLLGFVGSYSWKGRRVQ